MYVDLFVWADAVRALWRLYHRTQDQDDRQYLAEVISTLEAMRDKFSGEA